jgi:hypothetical protein
LAFFHDLFDLGDLRAFAAAIARATPAAIAAAIIIATPVIAAAAVSTAAPRSAIITGHTGLPLIGSTFGLRASRANSERFYRLCL